MVIRIWKEFYSESLKLLQASCFYSSSHNWKNKTHYPFQPWKEALLFASFYFDSLVLFS